MLREIGADVRGICTRPCIIGITGNLIYKALKKRLVSGVILLGTLFYLGNRALLPPEPRCCRRSPRETFTHLLMDRLRQWKKHLTCHRVALI